MQMTSSELYVRFEFLGAVLQYSRDKGYFSAGQRICLHQECAAILQAKDWIYVANLETIEPAYRIPDHLEMIALQVQRDFHF